MRHPTDDESRAFQQCVWRLRLAALRARSRGGAVVVVGEAGAGKTRLVRTWAESVHAPGAWVACSARTDARSIQAEIAHVERARDAALPPLSFIVVDDVGLLAAEEQAHLCALAPAAGPGPLWVLSGVSPEVAGDATDASENVVRLPSRAVSDDEGERAIEQRMKGLDGDTRALAHLVASSEEITLDAAGRALEVNLEDLLVTLKRAEHARLVLVTFEHEGVLLRSFDATTRDVIRRSLGAYVVRAYAHAAEDASCDDDDVVFELRRPARHSGVCTRELEERGRVDTVPPPWDPDATIMWSPVHA